jgi:hypothetical protein
VIPVETCCLRWQESLTLLAKLVEAETRDVTGQLTERRNSHDYRCTFGHLQHGPRS